MKELPKCVKQFLELGKRHHFPQFIIVCITVILLFFYHLGYSVQTKKKKIKKMKTRTKKTGLIGLGIVALCICIFIIFHGNGLFVRETKENATFMEEEQSLEEISDNTTRVVQERENTTQKSEETKTTNQTGNAEENTTEQESKQSVVSDYKPKITYNGCPYYISVNRLKNCVTIYECDSQGNYSIPLKAMRCSTGGENTPLGIYSAGERYEFRELYYDVYGQYAVRVVNDILFHSSSYQYMSKDSLLADEFNKLGKSVSHGCIRLTVEDAKWIYDNCTYGTVVEIYEDEVSGPLGKPKVIHIPSDSVWDPTDPDMNNPWNSAKPKITGVKNIVVHRGSDTDLLQTVQAIDSCGNDISSQIKIKGEYSFDEAGTYEITYYVKDLLGRTAKEKAMITVV